MSVLIHEPFENNELAWRMDLFISLYKSQNNAGPAYIIYSDRFEALQFFLLKIRIV